MTHSPAQQLEAIRGVQTVPLQAFGDDCFCADHASWRPCAPWAQSVKEWFPGRSTVAASWDRQLGSPAEQPQRQCSRRPARSALSLQTS